MLATPLDHAYIDEFNVAGRFVSGELTREELDIFERHYVDCPECMDRVALAQIFRADAAAKNPLTAPQQQTHTALGLFNFLGTFKPREQTLIFAVATLSLLLMPIAAMTWFSQNNDPRAESEPVIWLTESGTVEARVPTSSAWVSIASKVPDPRGVYRLSIVDAASRPVFVGPDQTASSGTAVGLRVPSLPSEISFAVVEKKNENGAYTLVSRHPLMVYWR